MPEKMATIAWQGIALKVPADWSLVAVPQQGETNKGSFQVDSPIASSLLVKWMPAVGKDPELLVVGRRYLSELEKTYRKRKIAFSYKIKDDKDQENSASFSYQSDRSSQGRLFYCPRCDRVIIAEVSWTEDENLSHLAPGILKSLRDHRDDGRIEWGLYGLRFCVPGSYTIDKRTMLSAKMTLTFKDRAKTLVVERWGLAGTLLDDKLTFKEWIRKEVGPDIKGYRFSLEDAEIRGHDGLKLSGRRRGIKQAAKALGASLTLHPHPGRLTGYAWHCPDSNRIFSLWATHTEKDQIADQVRDTIRCH